MRILDRVPSSVLWLFQDNPSAAENLRQQARLRGIAPGRLVFAKRVPLAQHLSRQRLAGLFLDTFPFNAGATASPALWAGLPVLTCMGQTFAGRMAASLLRAIDLPELIAATPEAYEALGIELALDPERLRDLRERLNAIAAPHPCSTQPPSPATWKPPTPRCTPASSPTCPRTTSTSPAPRTRPPAAASKNHIALPHN